MTRFSRSEVILVESAFSGTPGRKRRPAVVLSADEFHHAGTKLIVVGLTGNLAQPTRTGDFNIQFWREAGLSKPSMFRGVLVTVDQLDIVRPMGTLDSTDFQRLEETIARLLGFQTL